MSYQLKGSVKLRDFKGQRTICLDDWKTSAEPIEPAESNKSKDWRFGPRYHLERITKCFEEVQKPTKKREQKRKEKKDRLVKCCEELLKLA